MPRAQPVSIGGIYVIKVEDSRVMPFQVVKQKAEGTLSTCALIGRLYPDATSARAASPRWTPSDAIAEITVVTRDVAMRYADIEGELGKLPLLTQRRTSGFRHKIADAIRAKLGVRDEGLSHCSIGVLYGLANACAGLEPWDSSADPDFFEQFLIDPKNPLVNRRLKSEMGSASHPPTTV